MKTNSTIKHTLLTLAMVCSLAACKKDKKDPDPTPPVDVKSMTFTELKALSTGASVTIPDSKKITGVVISDASAKNVDSKMVILQEAADKPGIIVTFDAAQTFALNDQVEIDISKQTLTQVNGEVVLQNIPASKTKKTGTGAITAKTTTIADITTNKAALDGTLVSIAATELSGSNGKYTGSLTVKDASGTVASNVLAGATFENTVYPASVSSLTGIVRLNGNDVRIDIRKTSDVAVGAVTRTVTENFDGLSDADGNSTLNIGSWQPFINGWGTAAIFKDVAGDVNTVTEPGKAYPYLYNGFGYINALGLNSENLQGLKTVTVTFAYSKGTSILVPGDGLYTGADIYTFKPAQDKIQIGIAPKFVDKDNQNGLFAVSGGTATEDFVGLSPEYTETGKDFTYTYTMPTEAELTTKASGNANNNIAKFLAHPSFAIYNKCYVNNGNLAGAPLYSIIIKKVVLGFSN